MNHLILFLVTSLSALALTPDEIVRKADEFRAPDGSFSFTAKVEDKGQGSAKETTYRVYSKDAHLTRVETLTPERQRGRKLLMRDNDLWLYLPTVKRPTRVSFQQRLTGEVSNGDLARTLFSMDYTAKSLGEEKAEGKACVKLALTAKRKDVTYHTATYWVDKATLRPVKAEFHALSGKALKTAVFSGFEDVLGKKRMTRVGIADALSPAHQSLLVYSNFKRETLNDAFFNKESLAE